MHRSRFFMPTLKEVPSEAQIPSHRLMLRAGMIRQMSSGIYTWLPLGLRVLKRIEQIVREEQNRAGAQEVLMPTIQSADLWRESSRFDDYGEEMLRMVDRHGRDMLYGPTNEEMITDVFRNTVRSYRDLPLNLYHIQWKFRDEIRPRFGVMRGREFLMKDAYSFDLDYEGARKSYFDMMVAYLRSFARMGMRAIPLRANPGAIGGDLSHEFHIVAETGEGELFYDRAFDDVTVDDMKNADLDLALRLEGMYARADEEHDAATCPLNDADLRHARGVEVGHIFYFGTKYSAAMGATVTNAEGQQIPVEMGSYGVGVSRLVGGIIEASHDEAGIIWPREVAPFHVGLINIRPDDKDCAQACEKLYADFTGAGLDVLYDERDERPGGKFAEMDLIGLPWQVIVGPRGLGNGMVEIKNRASGDKQEVSVADVLARIRN